ncbi:hypothetical protein BT93_D0298 [Corymbia citriodora subsp. variegata]|nr:hypothetical protein BT93_D0298 [Corymbia citriodora subsp. variegata]
MMDEDSCIFFHPHHPRSQSRDPPLFLFMKGTGGVALGLITTNPSLLMAASLAFPEKLL